MIWVGRDLRKYLIPTLFLQLHRCIQETFHTHKIGFSEQSNPWAKSSQALQAVAWVAEGKVSLELCRKLCFAQPGESFQEKGIELRVSQGLSTLSKVTGAWVGTMCNC